MTAEFDREKSFATAMSQIDVLPPHRRIDALLEFFASVIGQMDSASVRDLRNQVMDRFSTCGCTFETTRLMIQFVDYNIALREVTDPSRANSDR
jgi:lipase chaperone LimK